MRLGSADAGSDPAGSTTRKAYDLLAKGFGPGYNGPLQLVAQVDGPAQQAAFAKVTAAVAKTSGVVRVAAPSIPGGRRSSRASPPPTSIPAARRRTPRRPTCSIACATRSSRRRSGSGVHVLIGGQTAIFDDFSTVLSSKLPLFIGVVVLLSFLLLMAVFRSLLIPAIAAVDEPAHRRRRRSG